MESTRCLSALALPVAALLAQQPPLAPITPLQVNPYTTPAVIATDAAGTPVTAVAQLELRPQGNTGLYRATCSLVLATGPRPQLASGTLDLGVTPPVWTPDADVSALNVANTTAFQLSMSPDGLVVVWDNYTGVTSASYPPIPSGPHRAFVCARPSTAVPFSPANVQAMFVGRPAAGFYWTDMHLGDAPPDANGHYDLFYSDSTLGGPGDIVRARVNPATGATSPPTVVVTKPPGNVLYYHSPYDLRDSQGDVRALTFGQSWVTQGNSDILWTRNATNTGAPYMVMDGVSSPAPPVWFSNGTTNGGTFTYGTYTSVQVEPNMVEHVLFTDSNVRNGQPVAAYAPIRPAAGAVPSFLSWFGVSTQPAPFCIPIPGIQGCLLIDQPNLLGVFGYRPHDNHTGLVEWSFGPYTPFWPPTTYPMQMITLDVVNLQLTFSNVADFTM